MENLFKQLRAILDEQEKATAGVKGVDVVFAVNEVGEVLADAISAFSEAAQSNIDEGGDGTEIVTPEPQYVPNFALLAQAAVHALAIRGDIVGQLAEAGHDAEAKETAAFLDAEKPAEAATRTIKVG